MNCEERASRAPNPTSKTPPQTLTSNIRNLQISWPKIHPSLSLGKVLALWCLFHPTIAESNGDFAISRRCSKFPEKRAIKKNSWKRILIGRISSEVVNVREGFEPNRKNYRKRRKISRFGGWRGCSARSWVRDPWGGRLDLSTDRVWLQVHNPALSSHGLDGISSPKLTQLAFSSENTSVLTWSDSRNGEGHPCLVLAWSDLLLRRSAFAYVPANLGKSPLLCHLSSPLHIYKSKGVGFLVTHLPALPSSSLSCVSRSLLSNICFVPYPHMTSLSMDKEKKPMGDEPLAPHLKTPRKGQTQVLVGKTPSKAENPYAVAVGGKKEKKEKKSKKPKVVLDKLKSIQSSIQENILALNIPGITIKFPWHPIQKIKEKNPWGMFLSFLTQTHPERAKIRSSWVTPSPRRKIQSMQLLRKKCGRRRSVNQQAKWQGLDPDPHQRIAEVPVLRQHNGYSALDACAELLDPGGDDGVLAVRRVQGSKAGRAVLAGPFLQHGRAAEPDLHAHDRAGRVQQAEVGRGEEA